jgi:hypothetical protein
MSVSWEDEVPVQTLPDDPTWRENFCFDGYDRKRDIGFWIHCGRWSLDPSIWREQVLLYLPGGEYLVHRGWGLRDSSKGPSAALLSITCEKVGEVWRLRYRGPARKTNTEELQAGLLTEGPQILLDLDVEFTSNVPVWDMTGGMQGQAWGKFHIEQTGRYKGRIAWGADSVEMDGFAWRDHSRGSRDMVEMGRHIWLHGELSRDRTFAVTMVENFSDGAFVRTLDKAVIWDEGKIYEARCINPPLLTSADLPPVNYEMTLQYEKGDVQIRAQQRRRLPHSTTRYMECFDGVAPPGLAQVVTYEGGTVLIVDGQEFTGHSERSYRLGGG